MLLSDAVLSVKRPTRRHGVILLASTNGRFSLHALVFGNASPAVSGRGCRQRTCFCIRRAPVSAIWRSRGHLGAKDRNQTQRNGSRRPGRRRGNAGESFFSAGGGVFGVGACKRERLSRSSVCKSTEIPPRGGQFCFNWGALHSPLRTSGRQMAGLGAPELFPASTRRDRYRRL